jgi:hypothetical protein
MNEARFTGFAGFWPFYVGEHREPMNRMMHFIGSSLGLVCLIATFVTGRWRLIPLGLPTGKSSCDIDCSPAKLSRI